MRATLAAGGLVFQDEDNLLAGKPWRPQIEQAIEAAHLVAVFWCKHSGDSQEVRKEFESAIAQHKDVMPVLFDSTLLPDSLGAFQGIDFREVVGRAHDVLARESGVLREPLRPEEARRQREKQAKEREEMSPVLAMVARGL